MHTKLQNLRLFDRRQILPVFVVVLIFCALCIGFLGNGSADAATASTINFQARLMNAAGAIAPDGNYDIEFKLYDTASTGGTAQGVCTGNCKWVETRTSGNAVTVANGYVTVNLGSVSSFGAGINWDQDLWLTMNVWNPTASSWDGEMSPRLKLTAVPYAFRAAVLAGGTGANTTVLDTGTPSGNHLLHLPAEDGTLCVQGSANCGFVTGGSNSFIQNGTSVQANANFNIRSAGTGSVTAVLQGANGQTADLLNLQTYNGTISTTVFAVNNVGDLTVQNVGVANGKTLTVNSGLTSLTSNSTTGDALNVSNSTSTGNILLLKDDTTTVLTVANGGAATWQNETDSVNAFRILNDAPASGELFGVDTTNSVLRLLANNSGHLSSFTTNSNNLSAAKDAHSTVVVNGFMYALGGGDCWIPSRTTTVQFARINQDGSTGTWTTTGVTAVPTATCGAEAATYNGYIYVHGGTGAAGTSDDIYYAKPNADGTISAWTTISSGPIDHQDLGMVAYNGFLYLIGGEQVNGTDLRNIYYARINADGSLGSFTTLTNALPSSQYVPAASTVANGYLYVLGSSTYDKISYGKINADGSIGTMTEDATNLLPASSRNTKIAVMKGYLYVVGGGSAGSNTVYYTQLNNNGTFGSFTTDTTTLPATRALGTVAVTNGYLYYIGGWQNPPGTTSPTNTVYYASGSRIKAGASLDLIGYSGEGLAEGGSAGQLTAGNTTIAGLLMVSGNATLKDGLTVNNALSVSGSALFQPGSDTSAAFQIRKADGTGLVAVDTSSNTVSLGVTGTVATSSTVNIANSTGAAQTVSIGSTNGTSGTTLQAGTNNLVVNTAGTVRATFNNSNTVYFGNGVTVATPNAFTISGTGSQTTAVAGGAITLQGGNATVGNANGGGVTITGGSGVGTGVLGLVSLAPTTFVSSGSTQTFNGGSGCPSCNVTGVDSYSSIAINATTASLSINIPVPNAANQVVGRILYVTAVSGSNDFTIVLGGTSISIGMKANSTATLIWNGTGWTAAGASSSTDLQSAYNNTQASAGAAELVLNPSGGAADGLTIRNNGTTPIVGGLLEVQTSVGSNLFSVNSNAAEFANNGGAENTTFTMWTGAPAGGSTTRYTTAGSNIATGVASVFADTSSTANTGIKNTLSSSLTQNLKYKVSYTVRHTSTTLTFTTLDTIFSSDGTATTATCASASTVYYNVWTRVDCTFTATSVGASNAIIIRHSDSVEHDFYVDNLSVTVSADANHAVDGTADIAAHIAGGNNNWAAVSGSTVTQTTSVLYDTSGAISVATAATSGRGVYNRLTNNIAPSVNTQYRVAFYARGDGTNTATLAVAYTPNNGTNSISCQDFNTQVAVASTYTLISCYFTTDATSVTNAQVRITQSSGSATTFYVDALTVTLNSNTASNVQVGGGNKGGPSTLFTLDRSSSPPIASNNDAYLGSLYYDTTSGRIQCYEADGWGACGAAPDNIVNLNPEYAGAVLNGSGIGTMTADFCSDDTALQINVSLCETGQAKNFYKWTSPQATEQRYSIYVTYQLPATFNGFSNDDTVQLIARTDSTSNAAVTYEMYKSTGSAVTLCGTGETTVVTSANVWQSVGINGNEATSCSFNSSSAGNFVIFKINMKAKSNANAYVSTLSFTTTGR